MAVQNFIAIYDMNFLDSRAPKPCAMVPISRLPTARGHQPTALEGGQGIDPVESPGSFPVVGLLHRAYPDNPGIYCQPFFPVLAGHGYFL